MVDTSSDDEQRLVLHVSTGFSVVVRSLLGLGLGFPAAALAFILFFMGEFDKGSALAVASALLLTIGIQGLLSCLRGVPVTFSRIGITSSLFGPDSLTTTTVSWSAISECFVVSNREIVLRFIPGTGFKVAQLVILPGPRHDRVGDFLSAIAQFQPRLCQRTSDER